MSVLIAIFLGLVVLAVAFKLALGPIGILVALAICILAWFVARTVLMGAR